MTKSDQSQYEQIYQTLRDKTTYITTGELAGAINVSERSLRRHSDDAGLLERASDYILNTYGYVILRSMRPPGVKLSSDPTEIRMVLGQWIIFERRIHDNIEHYRAGIRRLEHEDFNLKQLRLPLVDGQ